MGHHCRRLRADRRDAANFGLQVSRDGLPGSANLSDSRCNLRALLQNRNGTFAPF